MGVDNTQENLELYKVFVESVAQNEAKRLQANSTYMGFCGALAAVAASISGANIPLLAVAALLLSLIWYLTIRYHRDLAAAKFEVIDKLEATFSIKPYEEEERYMKAKRRFLSLSEIESLGPVLVGCVSAAFLVWSSFSALSC